MTKRIAPKTGDLVAHLLNKDDWNSVEHMDNWVYVYSKMPRKMRMVIDLKITGDNNKVIASKIGCSVTSVCNHVLKAKKRLLRGENII